jgi:hypothetical protein
MDKIKATLAALGNGARKIGKEIWSLVADSQWNFDPYKVLGFAAYIVAGILAFRVFDLLQAGKAGGSDLVTLAGLVGLIAGLGTSLFGMARKVDSAQVASGGQG